MTDKPKAGDTIEVLRNFEVRNGVTVRQTWSEGAVGDAGMVHLVDGGQIHLDKIAGAWRWPRP